MRSYVFDITNKQWVNSGPRGVPYIRYGESATIQIQLKYRDDNNVLQPFTDWAGQGYSFRFILDNDFSMYSSGTLPQAYSGQVSEIVIDGLDGYIPPAGRLVLVNKYGEQDTVDYVGYKDTIFYLASPVTLTHSYEQGDAGRLIDPVLFLTDSVDASQEASGIFTVSIDADSWVFQSVINGVSSTTGQWELQALAAGGVVDATGGSISLIGTIASEDTVPPPAPVNNYYTKPEVDALLASAGISWELQTSSFTSEAKKFYLVSASGDMTITVLPGTQLDHLNFKIKPNGHTVIIDSTDPFLGVYQFKVTRDTVIDVIHDGSGWVATTFTDSQAFLMTFGDDGYRPQTITAAPFAASGPAGALLNGEFYYIGGDDGSSVISSAYKWIGSIWQSVPAPNLYRSYAALVPTAAGKLLYYGGWNGTTETGSLEEFDPSTGIWSPLTAGVARSGFAFGTDGTNLFAFGGYSNGSRLNTFSVYTRSNDTWADYTIGAISARSSTSGCYHNGYFYVGGGYTGSSFLMDLWKIDVATQAATQLTVGMPSSFAAKRWYLCSRGGSVYAIGAIASPGYIEIWKLNATEDGWDFVAKSTAVQGLQINDTMAFGCDVDDIYLAGGNNGTTAIHLFEDTTVDYRLMPAPTTVGGGLTTTDSVSISTSAGAHQLYNYWDWETSYSLQPNRFEHAIYITRSGLYRARISAVFSSGLSGAVEFRLYVNGADYALIGRPDAGATNATELDLVQLNAGDRVELWLNPYFSGTISLTYLQLYLTWEGTV